jgi:putative phage-type endonuclease
MRALRQSDPVLEMTVTLESLALTADILCPDTDALPRVEWLEMRRQGLGGSDVAAAMGLSPYATPVSLWLDKVEGREDTDNERFEWGRRQEVPISLAFAEKTGLEVTRLPVMLRSKVSPFMLGNPDRFVGDDAMLEIKNVGVNQAHQWADGPPLHTRLQGQAYLFVAGPQFKVVHFAALIGGNQFVTFEVIRDDELIASMVAACEKFWTLVTLKRMPGVDGSEITQKALKAHYGKAELEEIEVSNEFVTLLEQRALAKAVVKMDTEKLTEIENEMIVLMKGAEIAMHDGEIVATWKKSTVLAHPVATFTKRTWNVPKQKGKK